MELDGEREKSCTFDERGTDSNAESNLREDGDSGGNSKAYFAQTAEEGRNQQGGKQSLWKMDSEQRKLNCQKEVRNIQKQMLRTFLRF